MKSMHKQLWSFHSSFICCMPDTSAHQRMLLMPDTRRMNEWRRCINKCISVMWSFHSSFVRCMPDTRRMNECFSCPTHGAWANDFVHWVSYSLMTMWLISYLVALNQTSNTIAKRVKMDSDWYCWTSRSTWQAKNKSPFESATPTLHDNDHQRQCWLKTLGVPKNMLC